MISAHSGSLLKSDELTVFEIEAEHCDKVDLVLFVCFLRASQDDVWDSYCANRQLQICLASWLVGGWVLSLGVSCHIKAMQWKKEKPLYPSFFVFFEAVVHQKEQFSFGLVIYIWTWKLYFVKQKKSSCPWQIKKLQINFISFHAHLLFRCNLFIWEEIYFRMIKAEI